MVIPLSGAGYLRVTHPCATLHPGQAQSFSFDLHVLSPPPAFVLSQDQTLHCKKVKIVSSFLLAEIKPIKIDRTRYASILIKELSTLFGRSQILGRTTKLGNYFIQVKFSHPALQSAFKQHAVALVPKFLY